MRTTPGPPTSEERASRHVYHGGSIRAVLRAISCRDEAGESTTALQDLVRRWALQHAPSRKTREGSRPPQAKGVLSKFEVCLPEAVVPICNVSGRLTRRGRAPRLRDGRSRVGAPAAAGLQDLSGRIQGVSVAARIDGQLFTEFDGGWQGQFDRPRLDRVLGIERRVRMRNRRRAELKRSRSGAHNAAAQRRDRRRAQGRRRRLERLGRHPDRGMQLGRRVSADTER